LTAKKRPPATKSALGLETTKSSEPRLPTTGRTYCIQAIPPGWSLATAGGGASSRPPAGTAGGGSRAGRGTTTWLIGSSPSSLPPRGGGGAPAPDPGSPRNRGGGVRISWGGEGGRRRLPSRPRTIYTRLLGRGPSSRRPSGGQSASRLAACVARPHTGR